MVLSGAEFGQRFSVMWFLGVSVAVLALLACRWMVQLSNLEQLIPDSVPVTWDVLRAH